MPGMDKTMHEFSEGKLHSGSKKGPVVKSRAQAIAIGLSEARKSGEHVAKPKHHSFASSDAPHGAASTGKPEQHHIEQGHRTSGPYHKMDGAGRHGADESGHTSYSEHKEPHHPSGGSQSAANPSTAHKSPSGEGAFGYPGEHLGINHTDRVLVGEASMMPAVLKHEPGGQGPTAGHPGYQAKMASGSHGFGHQQSQRDGVHRLSGHPKAHRIGKR